VESLVIAATITAEKNFKDLSKQELINLANQLTNKRISN
jgi:hypothetical protein